MAQRALGGAGGRVTLAPCEEVEVRFVKDARGETSVEYIVVLAIIIALVGPVLYAIFKALQETYTDVYNGL